MIESTSAMHDRAPSHRVSLSSAQRRLALPLGWSRYAASAECRDGGADGESRTLVRASVCRWQLACAERCALSTFALSFLVSWPVAYALPCDMCSSALPACEKRDGRCDTTFALRVWSEVIQCEFLSTGTVMCCDALYITHNTYAHYTRHTHTRVVTRESRSARAPRARIGAHRTPRGRAARARGTHGHAHVPRSALRSWGLSSPCGSLLNTLPLSAVHCRLPLPVRTPVILRVILSVAGLCWVVLGCAG